MYKERFGFAAQHFLASHILLVCLFVLIRFTEYFLLNQANLLPENPYTLMVIGIAFDVWFCFVLALFFFPVYVILYLIMGSFTKYFLEIAFIVYLIAYLALEQYYITTSIPLSSDFWGYSLNDIQTTIKASTGIGVTTYLPFIIIPGVLFYVYERAQEIIFPNWVLSIFYSLMLVSGLGYLLKTPNTSWFNNENDYTFSVNKLAYFSEKTATWLIESKQQSTLNTQNEFPFVHDADTADVLSPYFEHFENKPNFVFIVVEGLGGTFVGPNAHYGGCTPYLDSLAEHSLYWQNTLSTTGRTFGVLSSLFGSLPYNDRGFLETGSNMPTHLTLFSLLKQNGYKTHYFYGGNANFDLQDVFLEKQGVDYILGEDKFPSNYQKLEANSEGFSWGYSDVDVFKRSLELFPADTLSPTLSVYLTLNTHEPFKVPNQQVYLKQLEQISTKQPLAIQKDYKQYAAELSSLLYTDNAIRGLINQYKTRADFNNTIFIITGDHRMIPIPQANQLDRFHVPLIVYSPKLKRTQLFSSINTHHDVTPTLLSFLQHHTTMKLPSQVHWLGSLMDTTVAFHSTRSIALMRNKNELIDYIDGDYFLSNNIAYKISPMLDLEKVDDKTKSLSLQEKLTAFKQVNKYVFAENKLYSDRLSQPIAKAEFTFTTIEMLTLHFMGIDTLNPEQQFTAASKRFAVSQYNNARLICKYCLLTSPNFTDMRLLLGRSYAWEHNYDESTKQLSESVKRSPLNGEAWRAYIDNEIKFDHYEKAIQLAQEAYVLIPKKDFTEREKQAKILLSKTAKM